MLVLKYVRHTISGEIFGHLNRYMHKFINYSYVKSYGTSHIQCLNDISGPVLTFLYIVLTHCV